MSDGPAPNSVYFVGIGGVGMSALAQILQARGVRVTGSDPNENEATQRLKQKGAIIYRAQVPANVQREKPDLLVMTAAVAGDHPEVAAARTVGIPVVSRAQFLGRLMAESAEPRIAVAGTHGKTTTTSMIAAVLIERGLDPTVLVGGEFSGIGGNVRVGGGPFLTEACEAYDSFLALRPDIAVITNVEADHLDYYQNIARILESFRRFVSGMESGGRVIWCGEDEGARTVMQSCGREDVRSISYGFSGQELPSVWASEVDSFNGSQRFTVNRGSEDGGAILGRIKLKVPGRHNILNALAAAAVGLELGVPFSAISAALQGFRGAVRRFDVRGAANDLVVIDDYAHHPTEVRATLSAAKTAYPGRRIVAVFQPHLYSRTRDFLQDFADVLGDADAILVMDIYAAREKPIPGIKAPDLVRAVAARNFDKTVLYVPARPDAVAALEWITRSGDVILTMGAGDVYEVAEEFLTSLSVAA